MNAVESLCSVVDQAREDGLDISEAAVAIAQESIAEIDTKYGDGNAEYMAYHNAYHGVDVVRRGFRLIGILNDYIADKYRQDLPDLVLLGGAFHDIVQRKASGVNEQESANIAAERTRVSYDAVDDVERFIDRLQLGILATEVEITHPESEIIQKRLPNGRPDPLKYIMAFADINGIAMDGPERMIRDCVHLCHEIFGKDVTGEQIGDFLLSQTRFLRTRLNDRRVRSDLMYYFLDAEPEVYGLMRQAFEANIMAAANHAKFIEDNPGVFTVLANELIAVGHAQGAS